MNYVGIDLHKKTIVACVMDQNRKVLARRTLACCEVDEVEPEERIDLVGLAELVDDAGVRERVRGVMQPLAERSDSAGVEAIEGADLRDGVHGGDQDRRFR